MFNRSKPATRLLVMLPILVLGLFLLGEELPLPHILAIVAGVALYLVLFCLLAVWLNTYEARAAWLDAQNHAAGESEPEVKATFYPGRRLAADPQMGFDPEGFHWDPERFEDRVAISTEAPAETQRRELHWRDN